MQIGAKHFLSYFFLISNEKTTYLLDLLTYAKVSIRLQVDEGQKAIGPLTDVRL